MVSLRSSRSIPHSGSDNRAGRRSYADLPPDFETLAEAKHRRATLIRQLQLREDHPGAAKLLATLRSCAKSVPCRSAACPVCNRKFRQRFHRQAQAVVPLDGEFLAVSLIPKAHRVELDQLASFDLAAWVKSRQRGLVRALPSDAMFIGGVDVSLNTWANADPHWCLHIYGFVVLPAGWGVVNKRRRLALRAAIAMRCPLAEPIPDRPNERPLLVSTRTRFEFERKVLYGHKGAFYLRSRYSYRKRNGTAPSSNVVSHALPAERQVELCLFLSRYRIGARLLLVGLRRQGVDAKFRLMRPLVTSRRGEVARSPVRRC